MGTLWRDFGSGRRTATPPKVAKTCFRPIHQNVLFCVLQRKTMAVKTGLMSTFNDEFFDRTVFCPDFNAEHDFGEMASKGSSARCLKPETAQLENSCFFCDFAMWGGVFGHGESDFRRGGSSRVWRHQRFPKDDKKWICSKSRESHDGTIRKKSKFRQNDFCQFFGIFPWEFCFAPKTYYARHTICSMPGRVHSRESPGKCPIRRIPNFPDRPGQTDISRFTHFPCSDRPENRSKRRAPGWEPYGGTLGLGGGRQRPQKFQKPVFGRYTKTSFFVFCNERPWGSKRVKFGRKTTNFSTGQFFVQISMPSTILAKWHQKVLQRVVYGLKRPNSNFFYLLWFHDGGRGFRP